MSHAVKQKSVSVTALRILFVRLPAENSNCAQKFNPLLLLPVRLVSENSLILYCYYMFGLYLKTKVSSSTVTACSASSSKEGFNPLLLFIDLKQTEHSTTSPNSLRTLPGRLLAENKGLLLCRYPSAGSRQHSITALNSTLNRPLPHVSLEPPQLPIRHSG